MKVIILGAGLIGGPIALDLLQDGDLDITVVDNNHDSLDKLKKNNSLRTICQDLSYPDVVFEIIKDYDLVVNAVPGFIGFNTLESIIQGHKNVIDITFSAEDPFILEDLAKTNGITAIVDCGVAPGMSNLLIGYVDNLLDKTNNILIYVGGLPKIREWPYEYKAVFSPLDVIEEYTRTARYIENDNVIKKPALTDREYLNFTGVGTLEAFNSDGLRTLIKTIKCPNIKEKTLRYPGHAEKMAILRETGFFSKEEIEVNGIKIKPLDLTAKLLFPKWKMDEGDRDITVMKIIIEGLKDGQSVRYTYDLYNQYHEETQTSSMACTTGYTATTAVRMLKNSLFDQKGIIPPEYLGKDKKITKFFLNELKKKGIIYKETITRN